MKISSKMLAGVVLCAGLVNHVGAKNVNIKIVKEEPLVELEYAIDTDKGPSDWKKLKDGQKIKFDDNNNVKRLYVKRPNDGIQEAKKLLLLDASEQKKKNYNLIVVNEVGFPRYDNTQYFETFKNSRSNNSQPRSRM